MPPRSAEPPAAPGPSVAAEAEAPPRATPAPPGPSPRAGVGPEWRSPRFALLRALRRPTARARDFAPRLSPEQMAAIAAQVTPARRGRLQVGIRAAFLAAPLPRSGTNYVEGLIAAHPAVVARPLGLDEAAVLAEAHRLTAFARALARRHPSAAAIGAEEWLGYALAGVLHRVAAERGEARVALFKDPDMRGLWRLPAVLPGAVTILVFRDGRRTLDSHMRSWPPKGLGRWLGRSFADRCREWALATEAGLDFAASHPGVVALRFETAATDPRGVALRLWRALGLRGDEAALRQAESLPVLGSSTHSQGAGGVDWTPRPRMQDFDPAARPLRWPREQCRQFQRIAGKTQARLDALLPPVRTCESAPAEDRAAP